ncbi:GT4 family glycosyltransferase PelF [Devosia sp. XJ19-1]|uniref:GT4 family glycosyltransferase PelF n=1 Tax=Devosia ureilytica TaxID=2952754 RepID=A0A9Q4FRD5_9HYPH|nr:GT4 family glycosyltransferase PelF [Devosia ureilytica]MCP8883723.1 GT4 family glycosyltransferase PelF [Devosia ureilytica]MCP8887331.1 GT4 family glycosyltransferase PelF [Devosia ureilytica]
MWRDANMMPGERPNRTADVCLIAEGCYPYVAGGVSTWIDWLIRSHPELTFSVLAILPGEPTSEPRYARPSNLLSVEQLRLDDNHLGTARAWPDITPEAMAELIGQLLNEGEPQQLGELMKLLGPPGRRVSLDTLLNSPQAWRTLCHHYSSMSHAAFLGYFWAWRTLVGGLFRALTCPYPEARIYHAVSTGYAGLIGARAAIDTGRASLITEHGIYSNERRIEILMADWISNSVDTGLDLSDDRKDIRELWARSFESFARVAYGSATEITALYEANQAFQYALGAAPHKLSVIPNGVDVERFGQVKRVDHDRPTIGFIGRVTPIKDVQSFIDVAERLRDQFPDLQALVIGPMDEDPDYAQSCQAEVTRRGLSDTVTFTGPVNVVDYIGRIDVLVLTSISEALPLVILEAGAAGIPCVATDVGACREIIEGRSNENNDIGPGGMVAPVGANDEMAEAIAQLLEDPKRARSYGQRLQRRISQSYRSEAVSAAYGALYARNFAPQFKVVA